ncbi:MAG: PAS domain-containing sensor histidine kinase [Ignavibacteriales bacterium]|nr:MAG: PAS domain-containing sensor histidine kinase [Ignavibacteriales bacterium]
MEESIFVIDRKLPKSELEEQKQFLKEAEEEVDNLKERLNIVEEVSEYGFWDINLDTGSVYFNKNFAAILGCQPNELNSFRISDFDSFILKEDQAIFKEALNSHINNQSEWLDITVRLRNTEQGYKWVLFKGKVIMHDQNCIPLRFAGRIEDITLRKIAEEKIKSNLQKEHELNELHTRFISRISHELRTPLATILSATETIEKYELQLSTKQRTTLFSKIKSSIDELKEMLDDVTVLNKFDSNKMNGANKPFDIIRFTSDLIEEVKFNSPSHAQIKVEFDCQNKVVCTNMNLLKHVLINLLSNAIKYTPYDRNIYFRLKRSDDQVRIVIEDEGMGIPEDEQKNIFEPFYRASNVSNIAGTGLGLTIVKESLESLNGFINFRSIENTGTQFTLTFPGNCNNSNNQI